VSKFVSKFRQSGEYDEDEYGYTQHTKKKKMKKQDSAKNLWRNLANEDRYYGESDYRSNNKKRTKRVVQ
jgi:hypothetical protein